MYTQILQKFCEINTVSCGLDPFSARARVPPPLVSGLTLRALPPLGPAILAWEMRHVYENADQTPKPPTTTTGASTSSTEARAMTYLDDRPRKEGTRIIL